jgi:hypothetical protein
MNERLKEKTKGRPSSKGGLPFYFGAGLRGN